MPHNIKDTTSVLLAQCYQEATCKCGLIDFLKKIRTKENNFSGKYSIKTKDLSQLFCNHLWTEAKQASGHRKLKNKVTRVVIEYSNHENPVDPGAIQTIFDEIQKHLNILCNNIFCYTTENWKKEPDYQKSMQKLMEWNNKF